MPKSEFPLRVDIVPTQRRRRMYRDMLSVVFEGTRPGYVATSKDIYTLTYYILRKIPEASLSSVRMVLSALLLGRECSEDVFTRLSGFLASQHSALKNREQPVPQDIFTEDAWLLVQLLEIDLPARTPNHCQVTLDIYTGPQAGIVEEISMPLRRLRGLVDTLGYCAPRREPRINPLALVGCYAFVRMESEFLCDRDEMRTRCLGWGANASVKKKNRDLRNSRSRVSRRQGKAPSCPLGTDIPACLECAVPTSECERSTFHQAPDKTHCNLCEVECWVKDVNTSQHICVSCLGKLLGAVRVD